MNLKKLSLQQLDLAFAALPIGHELKDAVASEIESRVKRGEVNTTSTQHRKSVSKNEDVITKAFESLQLS
jgi:hypothetical protein